MKNSLLLLIIFFITSGTSAQYISKSQSGPMKYTGQRINQPNSRSVTSGDVNLTSLNSLKSIKSSNFRTENSLVQKLDSIIIQGINSNSTLSNSEKNSYDYDSAGNILSVTNYIWSDSLLSWHLLFRTEHSYANSGRMLTTTLYNDQGLADKTEYTYDSDGNRIKELQQTWNNSLNQLVNSSKSDYSFDLAGNLKTGTTLHWDDTLQAWYNWSLLEYSYDTAGRLNFKTYWSWINNEWFYPVKTVYAYNSTGLITSIEQYRAGSLPQQWIGLYRSSYEYDSATQLFSTTYQYWQEETNQWINMSKTEYAYSSQGSLLRDVEFNWYPSVSEWNPMIKFEYGYNEVGDRISEEYYYWNTVNSLWEKASFTEKQYKNEFRFDQLLLPEQGDIIYHWQKLPVDDERSQLFSHMLTGFSRYSVWDSIPSTPVSKGNYYYSESRINGIPDQLPANFDVFPIPATRFITFKWNTSVPYYDLELVSMEGKVVERKSIVSNELVPLFKLKPGIYTYTLSSKNSRVNSGKLIIQ